MSVVARGSRTRGFSTSRGCKRAKGRLKKNSLAKETAESRVFSPSFLYTLRLYIYIYIFSFAFSSVLAGLFIYRRRRHRLTFHAHGVSAILKTGRSPIGVSRIPRAATVHRRRRGYRIFYARPCRGTATARATPLAAAATVGTSHRHHRHHRPRLRRP